MVKETINSNDMNNFNLFNYLQIIKNGRYSSGTSKIPLNGLRNIMRLQEIQ